MKIKKNDDTYIDIIPIDVAHDIGINYKLVIKSDKKTISVDRGESTDRYACEFSFHGATDAINELYVALQALRENDKQVELTECNDNYFGDHIDHSIAINCVVGEMNELESKTLNTRDFTVTLISTDVTLQGTATLPSLTCLDAGWMGFNEWNTHVNETYNSDNYFVNRETDICVFEGSYVLSKDENADLLRYWSTQRGASFSINDGDFGITDMFGPNCPSISHEVVISSIEYSDFSPTQRMVNIRLFRIDGVALVLPVITVQPEDWVGASGGTATFTIVATNYDTLQWQKALSQFSAPQFVDADWCQRATLTHDITYTGATMVVNNVAGANYSQGAYFGRIESVDVRATFSNYPPPNVPGQYLVDIITAVGAPLFNRISLVRGEIAYGDANDLVLRTTVDGVGTNLKLADISNEIDSVICLYSVSGSDLTYDITVDDGAVQNFTGTIIGGVSQYAEMTLLAFSNEYTATYTKSLLIGTGFPEVASWSDRVGETGTTLTTPNVGTTGEPFGTLTRCVATNLAGDTVSNTVTTIDFGDGLFEAGTTEQYDADNWTRIQGSAPYSVVTNTLDIPAYNDGTLTIVSTEGVSPIGGTMEVANGSVKVGSETVVGLAAEIYFYRYYSSANDNMYAVYDEDNNRLTIGGVANGTPYSAVRNNLISFAGDIRSHTLIHDMTVTGTSVSIEMTVKNSGLTIVYGETFVFSSGYNTSSTGWVASHSVKGFHLIGQELHVESFGNQ